MNLLRLLKISIVALIGVTIYFISMNFMEIPDQEVGFYLRDSTKSQISLSKEVAMKIAQQEVDFRVKYPNNSGWSVHSKVVDAFPLLIDGIRGVSYYECKIKTNDQDAGYILVNVNKTDLLISESTQNGKTLTERYREQLDRDEFIVFRYDWFRSTAVERQNNKLANTEKILSSIGFEGIKTPKVAINKFRVSVLAKGCFPVYSQEELKDYYDNLHIEQTKGYVIGWGKNAWAGNYRNKSAELKHYWEGQHHTPLWGQFNKSNGHYIGCGPAAWAIIYGYWDKLKGKSRLFADNWNDIKNCMTACAKYTGTRDVYENSKKWGFTPPSNMNKGIRYAHKKGYPNSTCIRVRETNEFKKFDKIYSYIKADKPCILLLNGTGFGFPNHYVVVEKATKRQKYIKVGKNRWDDRDVYYTVNLGSKETSKEIWTREMGRNDHKHYSTFDVYLIDVK